MDPSSSSVRFPLSGNTQSLQNSTPLPSSVGFPPSRNTQSSEISPPFPSSSVIIPSSEILQSTQNPSSLHPPSFSVRIPFSANPQSNPEQQFYSNGPPTLFVSDADWNRELANLFHDFNFSSFMRGGACDEYFKEWSISTSLTSFQMDQA